MWALRPGFILLLAVMPAVVYAAAPKETNDTAASKMENCIQQSVHDCLDAICIPSALSSCAEKCKRDAKNKCKELTEQQL